MKLAESILELLYPSTCPGCGNHTSLKNVYGNFGIPVC